MSIRQALEQMVIEMKEHANNKDKEAAHSKADNLLCEALLLLSTGNLLNTYKYSITALLSAYEDVGRW